MAKDEIINAHIQKDVIVEYVSYPEHKERKESNLFKHSKQQLRNDGNYRCFICDCVDDLESHHVFEWSFEEALDLDKVKDALEVFDFYGYSSEMKAEPLVSLDDVRNQLVLCKKHHRDKFYGIHDVSFPTWLAQKVDKKGLEVVPESLDDKK